MNEEQIRTSWSPEIQAAVNKIGDLRDKTVAKSQKELASISKPELTPPNPMKIPESDYPEIVKAYRESFSSVPKEPVTFTEGETKSGVSNQGTDPNSRMVLSQKKIQEARNGFVTQTVEQSFELPKFEIPNVEIPNVTIPDVKIPDIQIPNIVLPKMEMPEVHTSPEAKSVRSDILEKLQYQVTYPEQKSANGEPVVLTNEEIAERKVPKVSEESTPTKTKPHFAFKDGKMYQTNPEVSSEVKPTNNTVEGGIPFMITNKPRAELKSHGVTDVEISKLTPAEAWQLLGQKKAAEAVGNATKENTSSTQEDVSPEILTELKSYGVTEKDIAGLSTPEVMVLLANKRSEQKKKPDLVMNLSNAQVEKVLSEVLGGTTEAQKPTTETEAFDTGTEKEWSERLLIIASKTTKTKSLADFLVSVGVQEPLSALLTDNPEIFSAYKAKIVELEKTSSERIKRIEAEIKILDTQLGKIDASGGTKNERELVRQNIKERQAEIKRLKQEYALTYQEKVREMLSILQDSKELKTFSASLQRDEQKFYESLTLEEKRAYRPSWIWDRKIMRAWIEAKRSTREKVATFLEKITGKLKSTDAKLAEKKIDTAAQAFVKKGSTNLREKFTNKKVVLAAAVALGLGGVALKNYQTTDPVFEPGRNVAEASSEKPSSPVKPPHIEIPKPVSGSKTVAQRTEAAKPKAVEQQKSPVPPVEPPTKLVGFDIAEQGGKDVPAEKNQKPTTAEDNEYETLHPANTENTVITTIPVGREGVVQNAEKNVREKINSIYQKNRIETRQNAENLSAQQIKAMVFDRAGGSRFIKHIAQTPPEVYTLGLWNNVIDSKSRELFLHDLQDYLRDLEQKSGLAPQGNESVVQYANRAESTLLNQGSTTQENKKVSPEMAQLQLEVTSAGKEMRTIPRNILDDIASLSAGQFLKDRVIGNSIMSGTWEFGERSADQKYKEATMITAKYLLALKQMKTAVSGEHEAAPRQIESIGQYINRLNTQN